MVVFVGGYIHFAPAQVATTKRIGSTRMAAAVVAMQNAVMVPLVQ